MILPYIIFTTRPESTSFAISEWQKYDSDIRPVRTLQPGVLLMSLPGGWGKFVADAPGLIFTRHIFPAQYFVENAIKSSGVLSEDFNMEMLLSAVEIPTEATAGTRSFSIQVRGGVPHEMVYILEEALVTRGFEINVKHPAWVLSLYTHKYNNTHDTNHITHTLYAGASFTIHNRSRWNGGAARYKQEGILSRAEHKLTEAIEVFGLRIEPDGYKLVKCESNKRELTKNAPFRALDLGAAPGGWTKVLLEAGAHVTAVDPGALDTRITAHPRLQYICATAQRFFAAAPKGTCFDFIVNDMKMDMYDSIRIMNDAADFLSPGGNAVITLKLKPGQGLSKINKALALLQEKYRVAGTRQLFHNRDEVTVCLTHPGN